MPASGEVIVKTESSISTSSITSYFLGFKASVTSVVFDITTGSTTGQFNLKVGQYGWNDGTTCQLNCTKTLYTYNYLSADVPGQYACFGKHLIISGILVLLALLF